MKYKQLLLSSLLLAGAAHAEKVRLENRFLSREWDTEGGVLRTVAIGNKLAGKSSAPGASDEFRVSVTPDIDKEGGGTKLSAKDFKVTGVDRSKKDGVESVVFHLAGDGFKADLTATLGAGDFYLRKKLELTATKPRNLDAPACDVLAEGMLWTEAAGPAFRRSRMHGGEPINGEVYDAFGDTVELTLAPQQVKILNFDKSARDWSRLSALQKSAATDAPGH